MKLVAGLKSVINGIGFIVQTLVQDFLDPNGEFAKFTNATLKCCLMFLVAIFVFSAYTWNTDIAIRQSNLARCFASADKVIPNFANYIPTFITDLLTYFTEKAWLVFDLFS